MRAAAELAGTVDYSPGWLILAIGLLSAVVGWNAGLLLWGRPRRVREVRSKPVDLATLPARYLALIDQIEAGHADGRVGMREAHRRLSAVTRAFVQESTGVPAASMTLTDLRREELPGVVDLVELVYPPAFEPGTERPEGELDRALAQARKVVTTSWT